MSSVSTDRRRGINSGAAIKVSCICATTADITLSGEQTIDGITTDGTRVLVKNQSDASENGIYLSGTSAWTREPDFDGTYDVTEGTMIPVSRGTVNAATLWRITNTGTITIGTTELTISAQALDAAAILSDGSVSYAADFLPATTQTHNLGSKTYQWLDIVHSGDLVQAEKADHTITPAAGYGQWWTKSDAPCVPMFTDDTGGDWYLVQSTTSPATTTTLPGSLTVSDGQIIFPASQNASANANTLDDYEEGTWTPHLNGNEVLAIEDGTYTKIGRLVFFNCRISITTIGTGSTTVIYGLPFASAAGSEATPVAIYGWSTLVPANIFSLHFSVGAGGSQTINITVQTASTSDPSSAALFQDGSGVMVAGCYETD